MFDDQTLIAGSINVGDEYMGNWHDYMVRMDSPILVSKLRARLSGNDDFDSGASIEF
ncbi:phosphatidylserine/phosphatidylglycerophosphate/cardiolipin synthase family protein [Candidatus Peregrinibacteria bacterium]|nr:phosphatidylserine/phosphatidylglycerophosphate/cardiolipin synthase family protein [Candidatus Peregrinibacteria bacterium]